MRFIIIVLAMFVALMFLPGMSPADTVEECQKKCSAEMSDSSAKCPPPGKDTDKDRSKCLKDIESDLKDCREACVKFSSWQVPKDVPADEPKDAIDEGQKDAPPVAPQDAPK